MKFIKKHWFKVLNVVLAVTLSVYVLSVGIQKAKDYEIYKKPSLETKVYTVWHVETFEGGGKSRIMYLNKIAKSIEKANAGILFAVKQIAPEKLSRVLEENSADIISFGYGVGEILLPYLLPLTNTYNVREELVESGTFNNQLYALPYIMSGYAMITHNEETENFHCGENGYTNPSEIYNTLNKQPVEKESQYEAYKDFVNNKNVTLLGTARDVFRINNLNSLGRTNATISPISSYSDLVQYIGLTNSDKITNLFLSLALNDENQVSLTEYSLFSSKHNKIYVNGIYNTMEDAIFNAKIPKVFNEKVR